MICVYMVFLSNQNRMTVPPNALASLSIWGGVWLSAHYKLRAPFIIGAATIAILGMFSQ